MAADANAFAVFSNASGKNEQVDTTQQREVRSNYFSHREGKDIERKFGFLISRTGTLFQRLYIAFSARESEKPALMIEQIFQFIGIHFLFRRR